MDRVKVQSSNVDSVGHDGTMLQVAFKNGKVYNYLDVPVALHAELMKADSVGKFVAENIKGQFKTKQVE